MRNRPSAEEPSPDRVPAASSWPASVVAAGLGPGAALLHERGALSLGGSGTLGPVAVVVAVALAAALVGLWALRRRPRWPAVLALLANGAVLLFYGFLLLFFGLGGSR